MSMNAINQLNNGGLKLKTNFSAKSVAANISANKGNAAAMVKNGYNTFGTNSLFTAAKRTGGTPKYVSGAQISRAMNRQNTHYVRGGTVPTTSNASYAKNVNFGNSNDYNTGLGVGSMINMGLSALKQLKDMGIIGGAKDTPTSQGAGNTVMESVNNTLGNTAVTLPVSADIKGTLEAMENATTRDTLSAAISSAEAQETTFSNQQGVYETAAAQEQTQLMELDKQTGALESAQVDAKQELGKAKQETETMTSSRDRVKAEADQFGQEYSKAVDDYTKAHDAKIDAQANKDNMQTQAERADTSYKDAQAATKDAQGAFDKASAAFTDAQNAYNAEPETITQADGSTVTNPNKAALKAKMEQAEAQKNVEQTKLHNAQTAEKNAKTAKDEADKKLEQANKQYDSAVKAEEAADNQKKAAAKNVTQNKEKLAEFEKKLTQHQSFVETAKGKQEAAQEKFLAAKEAFDNHKAKMESMTSIAKMSQKNSENIQSLKDCIQTQKNRLSNMPVDGGQLKEIEVKGKLKDLSTVSNTYLQNALKGAIDLEDKDQQAKIQAEIDRRQESKVSPEELKSGENITVMDEAWDSKNAGKNGRINGKVQLSGKKNSEGFDNQITIGNKRYQLQSDKIDGDPVYKSIDGKEGDTYRLSKKSGKLVLIQASYDNKLSGVGTTDFHRTRRH